MRHKAFPGGVTRAGLVAWYRKARARTRELFDMVVPDAYYDRPIALRNPIVFYEGHLPAFSVNTLVKLAMKGKGIDERLETLFARGIDPETEATVKSPTDVWPSRDDVQRYADAADALIEETLLTATLEDDAVPELRGGEAVFTILEHELMHHETLLYMLHNLAFDKKVRRAPLGAVAAGRPLPAAKVARRERVQIPRGKTTVGATRDSGFGWDNEFPSLRVDVDSFSIDRLRVTNGDYLEYVEATDAPMPHFWMRDGADWCWRSMFEPIPLELDAPVYVTFEEADAYCRWRGARLPTEAEYHRAAFGTPSGEERAHPWGNELPDSTRGNFDFVSWDPTPVGTHPSGQSAWGVHDLVGDGWEWTSLIFRGFPGFEAMPSYLVYSADFFDDAHYVLKGASTATSHELVRRSFRNWFRPNYPYVYATFRCVW